MKYVFAIFALIVWFAMTCVAACTILGLIVLISETDWFDFPLNLANKLIK